MAQKSNLTIEVLSIIGGVLTAIFFLGFLVLSSILRSETSCLITGSILIITTLFVNRLLTKTFSGCDEYYMLHSRMYISRLWNE